MKFSLRRRRKSTRARRPSLRRPPRWTSPSRRTAGRGRRDRALGAIRSRRPAPLPLGEGPRRPGPDHRMLDTYSGHIALGKETRARLDAGISRLIQEGYGGRIVKGSATTLYVARKGGRASDSEPPKHAPHGPQVPATEIVRVDQEGVKVVQVAARLEEAVADGSQLRVATHKRVAKRVEEAYEG